MMMIGDPHHNYHRLAHNPTLYNPPWDPTVTIHSPSSSPTPNSPLSVMTNAVNGNSSPISSSPTANNYFPSNYNESLILKALSRYLPSNEADVTITDSSDFDAIDDGFSKTDEFRMYEFKVRGCTRPKAHDWTECPFAHPGEKARRRDPRRYSYSGTACSDFRKGSCRRGDTCEFAHGVFECWLHPTRYRTQACKDGPNCTRRVCFFAHAPGQLRVSIGPDSIEEELVASIRNLQLSKVKSMPARPGWKFQVGLGSPRVGSGIVRSGFFSLPTTPTQMSGTGWEKENEPELMMERVESGRELRARMFEKLSKENPLSLSDPVESGVSSGSGPDVGWVTELVLN